MDLVKQSMQYVQNEHDATNFSLKKATKLVNVVEQNNYGKTTCLSMVLDTTKERQKKHLIHYKQHTPKRNCIIT
jgi:hypothetical protein